MVFLLKCVWVGSYIIDGVDLLKSFKNKEKYIVFLLKNNTIFGFYDLILKNDLINDQLLYCICKNDSGYSKRTRQKVIA